MKAQISCGELIYSTVLSLPSYGQGVNDRFRYFRKGACRVLFQTRNMLLENLDSNQVEPASSSLKQEWLVTIR